jgi:hypothetical protein
VPLDPGDRLLITSDGIRTQVDLSRHRSLLREHPAVLAHHVLDSFSRDSDDATVLVLAR